MICGAFVWVRAWVNLSREYLDALYLQSCSEDFVKSDPVCFVHQSVGSVNARELVAFLVSLFCFGLRKSICAFVRQVLDLLHADPYAVLQSLPLTAKKYQRLNYRFVQGQDIFVLLWKLRLLLDKYGSLSACFFCACRQYNSVKERLHHFVQNFHKLKLPEPVAALAEMRPSAQKFLLPSPYDASACKRLNLFLKWMIRKDIVDPGLWQGFSRKTLIIPMDTHVAKAARHLALLNSERVHWNAAVTLSARLQEFSPDDPVKYDLALFSIGLNLQKKRKSP